MIKIGDIYRLKAECKRGCNWGDLVTIIKIDEEYTDLKIHYRSLINSKIEESMWENGFHSNYRKVIEE